MKEHRNILGWLGMTGEKGIIQEALCHVEETCRTVALLAEAVEATARSDLSAKTVAIEKVKQSEREAVDQLEDDADEQKRAFIDVIAGTPLSPLTLLWCYHLAETL